MEIYKQQPFMHSLRILGNDLNSPLTEEKLETNFFKCALLCINDWYRE